MATEATTAVPGPAPRRRLGTARPRYFEKLIEASLFLAAAVSVFVTTAIIFTLVVPTIDFFREVPIGDFLFKTEWAPAAGQFGVLPLIIGTLHITFWALLFGIPFGLGAAIYMSEYATPRVRRVLKPVLEVLEGIPTIVYGVFGIVFLVPLLQSIWPGVFGELRSFNVFSAGLIIGIMIIPTIGSIAEDAMSAVPRGLREAGYGVGANRFQVTTRVVFPAAFSGIVAGMVLGFSRVIGETIVVLLIAGAQAELFAPPTESQLAMTAYIASTGTGDLAVGSTQFNTVFAVGSLLFVITFFANLLAIELVKRYRQQYFD